MNSLKAVFRILVVFGLVVVPLSRAGAVPTPGTPAGTPIGTNAPNGTYMVGASTITFQSMVAIGTNVDAIYGLSSLPDPADKTNARESKVTNRYSITNYGNASDGNVTITLGPTNYRPIIHSGSDWNFAIFVSGVSQGSSYTISSNDFGYFGSGSNVFSFEVVTTIPNDAPYDDWGCVQVNVETTSTNPDGLLPAPYTGDNSLVYGGTNIVDDLGPGGADPGDPGGHSVVWCWGVLTNWVKIISISDGIHPPITVFDGSGELSDFDITVRFSLDYPASGTVWLHYDTGGVPTPGSSPRVKTTKVSGLVYEAVIPSSDERVAGGALIEFIIEIDGKFYPFDPPTVGWKFQIKGIPGVEILCNVPKPTEECECKYPWITYDLTRGTHVSIKIYDVLGRLVREISHYREAGGHYDKWDCRNFAGKLVGMGRYFMFIRTDDGSIDEMRMIIVVK